MEIDKALVQRLDDALPELMAVFHFKGYDCYYACAFCTTISQTSTIKHDYYCLGVALTEYLSKSELYREDLSKPITDDS